MSEAFVVKENPNGKFILSLSEQFHQDFPDFVCHQSYGSLDEYDLSYFSSLLRNSWRRISW